MTILNDSELQDYLKLKEKRTKQTKYNCEYIKNRTQYIKEHDPEEYKKFLHSANEANKKYKRKALEQLKEDPVKYNEYKIKQCAYKNEWNLKKRQHKQQEQEQQKTDN